MLSLVEQLSAVEIAAVTDTNLNTLYSRIRKVRTLFSKFAAGEGVDYP